jgi:hypothetical protein
MGLMRTFRVFLLTSTIAFLVLEGCGWILAHDKPLPVNADTYVTCQSGIKCLRDGQECPLTGDRCIDVPPSICSVPPCAMAKLRDGGAPRDVGLDAGQLVDAGASDAKADR